MDAIYYAPDIIDDVFPVIDNVRHNVKYHSWMRSPTHNVKQSLTI